ncbi:hypothetical protein FE257_011727 [Aspergillus nanangensis]|uniref:Uncharacterized protein n=1 Tax=Aspergillus nanangensis TaxID=2582783 RepID=A0AAD4CX22_ASPNN|nr:hypothetical protein FE257_011727 [Aspergillus nanangensis]
MAFPRHLIRRTCIIRPNATPLRPTQHFIRRSYASAPSHGSFEKTPHHSDAHHDTHGATEEKSVKQHGGQIPAGDTPPQPDRDAEQKVTESSNPGSTSAASSEGSSTEVPQNPGRSTVKTDNPSANEPEKRAKGEDESESG